MIQIDIDADLNMVDDADRNLARLPANSAVFFRQVTAREATAHGEPAVAASG